MATTKEIKRRVKSIRNTIQITKAMEMIASVKLRKATIAMQKSRDYVRSSYELLANLCQKTTLLEHALLQKRDTGKTALIVIASDKGLAGSFNTEILKKTNLLLKTGHAEGKEIDIYAIGNKIARPLSKNPNNNLVAVFEKMGDTTEFIDSLAISNPIFEKYQKGEYQKVVIIYTHFQSNLKQIPTAVEILPLGPENQEIPGLNLSEIINKTPEKCEYIFEPKAQELLEILILQMIKIQLFQTILESNASEHSARMLAMRNATDNAKEIADDLEFTYNQLRQAKITGQILEIAAGAEAI